MNIYEMTTVPVCGQSAPQSPQVQQAATTTFLTTHLPLAVESLSKTTKHADATVSRRSFGPNDCVVMTTWLEKFTYSTVKSTAVGKPVVSDSLVIPPDVLQAACCPQGTPTCKHQPCAEQLMSSSCQQSFSSCPQTSSTEFPQTSSTECPQSTSSDCRQSTSTDCPQTTSSDCQQSSLTTPTIPTISDISSDLQEMLAEMGEESEEEMCTDSEDEEDTDQSVC